MTDDDIRTLCPNSLDDPPKLLFWDMDVAFLFVVIFGIGIVAGQFILGSAGALCACWLYTKAKSGKVRGYGIHLMNWHLPIGVGFKRIPPTHKRDFQG
jgi:conjugal transfer pilus assembly protein TraL